VFESANRVCFEFAEGNSPDYNPATGGKGSLISSNEETERDSDDYTHGDDLAV
jgi:hypothetical protein